MAPVYRQRGNVPINCNDGDSKERCIFKVLQIVEIAFTKGMDTMNTDADLPAPDLLVECAQGFVHGWTKSKVAAAIADAVAAERARCRQIVDDEQVMHDGNMQLSRIAEAIGNGAALSAQPPTKPLDCEHWEAGFGCGKAGPCYRPLCIPKPPNQEQV